MPSLATNTRVRVTQWSPGIKPTWAVDDVRNALRLHAAGDFSLSSQLVDSMGEDDELPGLLEKRVDGLIKSDFRLEPVTAPNRQLSERLVSRFEPSWWATFPEGELHEFYGWRRMLGVSIGTFDWELGGSEWRARFRCLHPQFLRWDDTRSGWYYQAKEGDLRVEPGNGTWILSASGQRSWMRCGARALAIAWLAKQLTIRDWNRYNERHGLPIIKAMAPAIADDTDTERFFEDARELNSEIVAALPTHLDENGAAFDLDLLEAKDTSWQSFEAKLDRCDRRFSVYLLGGNLGTEVNKDGARSAADSHRGVERDKATADAQSAANELREQGLYPVIAVNVSSVTLDVIPWPKWETAAPEDAKTSAEAKKSFGDAVKAVSDAGYEIENITELGEKYDLKLKAKPKPEPPVAPVPPPGGNQPPPPGGTPPEPKSVGAAAGAFLGAIAASGTVTEAPGFVASQLYADALTEAHTAAAIEQLKKDQATILEAIEAANGYDDLRERLRAAYEGMDADVFTQLVESALQLGALAGRLGVQEDVRR